MTLPLVIVTSDYHHRHFRTEKLTGPRKHALVNPIISAAMLRSAHVKRREYYKGLVLTDIHTCAVFRAPCSINPEWTKRRVLTISARQRRYEPWPRIFLFVQNRSRKTGTRLFFLHSYRATYDKWCYWILTRFHAGEQRNVAFLWSMRPLCGVK